MQRKFILNLILIIFVNLLIKPLYIFGLERNVQNILGATDYGLYYALFNLSFIMSIILDPGITNYNNRHIAQNTESLSNSFSTITTTKVILSIVYVFAMLLYAVFSSFSYHEWQLISLLILGQIFNSFTLYNRSNLSGLHHFKTDTFISILDKLLMLILCIPIIYFGVMREYFSIRTFIFLQTCSFAGAAFISFFYVKKYTQYFKFTINWEKFKHIIKESYPFAVLGLLMLIYTKSDTVLLKEIHPNGNEEVGIYAAAYRLIDALNMIAVLFSGLLYPLFARMIKEKTNVESLVKTAFSLLVVTSGILAVFTFIYSKEIIDLLYVQHINESAEIFGVLIFSFVFICNSYVFGTLLTANGSIKLLNTIAFIAALLNIILNIIFIPTYGAKASAYISLSSFFFVSICQVAYSFKIFKFNISISYILRAIISFILVYLVFLALQYLNFSWIISLFIGLFTSIIIVSLSRLLPIKDLTLLVVRDKIV